MSTPRDHILRQRNGGVPDSSAWPSACNVLKHQQYASRLRQLQLQRASLQRRVAYAEVVHGVACAEVAHRACVQRWIVFDECLVTASEVLAGVGGA